MSPADETAPAVTDPTTTPPPVDRAAPPELIVVPTRQLVLFPNVVFPVNVNRPAAVAAAQQAVREQQQVLLVLQRDPTKDDLTPADLNQMGVVANVLRYITAPDGGHHIICQGVARFRVESYRPGPAFLTARGEIVAEPAEADATVEARFHILREQVREVLDLLPQTPPEFRETIEAVAAPGALADLAAAYLDIKPEEKQSILEAVDLGPRLEKITTLLAHRLQVLRLSEEIGKQTRSSLDERQREILLREQMAAIQKELGEDEGARPEIAELEAAIEKAQMPPDIAGQARKELRRLQRTPESSPESGIIRTYLETLSELPWAMPKTPEIDIAEARRILDEDHYGLEKIKDRIVEYLAVRKLAPDGKAPILCFVGPPGVGKTSLGQSIARAMGRPFVRVSLGGVHDEAEIRGHRRTYIGALPGRIIQALRKAGSRDAVMMLDEIDKMGAGVQGDPFAAMLEVLDPEQNNAFVDNYVGAPFDLSRVAFLTTANMLETIPGPLRDRMEIISLAGYTAGEKLEIAKRYLVRRQLVANGLNPDQAQIEPAALTRIIEGYTREAGVRNLEREIGRVLRHVAVRIAEGSAKAMTIGPDDLDDILGAVRFENETAMRTSVPGVATGLAWTPVGGDILFIEAARMPGGGRLILTGQLGEVMRESAQAALSLVKGKAEAIGIDPKAFEHNDIHIHVPAGATPKDGPSAGVAMFMALTSLFTGRTIRSDTAMTGEISLRGLVLPVGGIKEKVVAAAGAGLTRVMLPARNRRDYDDIPEEARNKLEFFWLERVEDAVATALDPPGAAQDAPGATQSASPQQQAAQGR
jgi:ATP-dependent Lon protease